MRRGRLAVAVILAALPACSGRPQPEPPADVAQLEQTRNALRTRLAELRGRDARLAQVPEGSITIGVPVAFLSRLVEDVTAGFLDQVQIALRDIKVKSDGDVHVKKFFAMKPGRYSLDMNLEEVRGVLQPGKPRIEFKGNRLELVLPVTLAKGEGRATIDFKWDSQGVASAVCEDFAATQKVTGSVRPRTYTVKGAFELKVDGGSLVAEPKFTDLLVELIVEPSAATWEAVGRLVEERSWKCEKALGMVDIAKILKGVLDKGFKVRIPAKIFRPIRIPAGLQQSLSIEGQSYALSIQPRGLELTPEILWFGAGVEARRAAP